MSHPTMDFETYSEAGYYLTPDGKWKGITKTNPGIGAVGAPVYSEHPSTRVLSLAWDLGDGPMLWVPPLSPPVDLFAYIAAGGVIEAWNSAFEYYIWLNVCHKRMGWPALPYEQLRCAMAKSRAHSLPGKLEKAAEVVGLEQKDKTGDLLIRKLCIPTNSKKPPTLEDYDALYRYNMQDLRAEESVSSRCPDLSPFELDVWLLDQSINFRGVHVDRAALSDCREIIRQATERYTAELQQLTGGMVQTVGELANMTRWLGFSGVYTNSLESDAVDALLERGDIPANARRVLEIRSMLGAASVKKLEAIDRMLCSDGRLRDLFVYCGADRTGRFAGRGPQPQNMPGGLPAEEVEDALACIALRNLDAVEAAYGNAVAVVSGCLRALFTAAPGCDLICSDFSAIEAVVLAELAGEEWRQEVFRTHGKIYEMSAAKITGIPFEEFARYKAETGDHHPMRKKVGKVAELACFTHDTQVLTDSGLKRIVDVTADDFLWDGVEWVKSEGAILKGKRRVINVDGVGVTPDHPISLGRSWKVAKVLASNKSILRQALAFGSENIPLSPTRTGVGAGAPFASVLVGRSGLLISQISTAVRLRVAGCAAVKKLKKLGLNYTQNTRISSPIPSTDVDSLTGSGLQSRVATHRPVKGMKTTGAGVLRFVMRGAGKTERLISWLMSSLSTVGIMLRLRWTEQIPIEGTSRETSASSVNLRTDVINGVSSNCKSESTNLRDVYDIVNAGPRHRFTIKTDSGYLVVHNSGYGGGLGAWKAFGADEFMTDEEIQENVRAWRAASPAVVALWWGLQEAAVMAISNPSYCYSYRSISYGVQGDILYCLLPSGRRLTYHKPRVATKTLPWGKETLCITFEGWNSNYLNGPVGWMRLETYGPKLTENVVQAVSRDLLVNSMLNLDRAGYPIVLHVHDEIVAEVPKGWGGVEEFEQIMGQMPEWAAGWPVRAAGGWRGLRYRKD